MTEFREFFYDDLKPYVDWRLRNRGGLTFFLIDRGGDEVRIPRNMAPREFISKHIRRCVITGDYGYVRPWNLFTQHMSAPKFRAWLAEVGRRLEATSIHVYQEVQATVSSMEARATLMSLDFDYDLELLDRPPNQAKLMFSYMPEQVEFVQRLRSRTPPEDPK